MSGGKLQSTDVIDYQGECRNCDHHVVVQVDATVGNVSRSGVHGRCGECGTTNWLDRGDPT